MDLCLYNLTTTNVERRLCFLLLCCSHIREEKEREEKKNIAITITMKDGNRTTIVSITYWIQFEMLTIVMLWKTVQRILSNDIVKCLLTQQFDCVEFVIN